MQPTPYTKADHYAALTGGRAAQHVANYAHTTPLPQPVAPVTAAPIVATTAPIAAAPVTKTVTTTTTTAATQPVVSQPLPTQYTTTQPISLAPAAVAAAPLATQSTTTVTQQPAVPARPTQVVQTIYPSNDGADAALVGAGAGTAAAVAATQVRQTQQSQVGPAPVAVGAARRGLDLDVGATHIDSYGSAPTPIHLTIHQDPDDDAPLAADSNAIAYLHSVHPALPANTAATTQPSVGHAHTTSEGAATSLNGLWTPLPAGGAARSQQHGDQVYASEAPVVPARPMAGATTVTNVHDNQQYSNVARVDRDRDVAADAALAGAAVGAAGAAYTSHELPATSMQGERIQHVDDVSGVRGEGRTAVPVAGAYGAAAPLITGETREMGGVGQTVSHVGQASGLRGEPVLVSSMPPHATQASQAFHPTGGPSVVEVADASNLQGGMHTPVLVDAATTAPLIIGQTHEVGSNGEPLEEVDDVSRVRGDGVVPVPVTHTKHRATQSTQWFEGEQRVPSIVEVADTSALSGERLPLEQAVSTRPTMTSVLPVTGQTEQIVNVSHASQLQGDMRTPVLVSGSSVDRPLIVGQTDEQGSGVNVMHTTEMRGERLPLEQPVSTRPTFSSVLPVTGQTESIVNVSHASQLQGDMRTPVMVSTSTTRGPLIVGQTEQVGSGVTNVLHTTEMRGERLPIANTSTTTTGNMRTYELTAAESQPQILHTYNQTSQAAVVQQQPIAYNSAPVSSYNASAAQSVQQQHIAQQALVQQERTVVTREPVSAEEAAARATVKAVNTSDATYESLTTQQQAGLEEQHIGGRTHIAYVDKERMEGREPVPVGAVQYQQYSKDGDVVDDGISSGVKSMQLNNGDRQTYSKEQI